MTAILKLYNKSVLRIFFKGHGVCRILFDQLVFYFFEKRKFEVKIKIKVNILIIVNVFESVGWNEIKELGAGSIFLGDLMN